MDLVNYIQHYLKTPSTSVATRTGGSHMTVPSRALVPQQPNIIDGEWSHVPKELGGPKGSLYQPGTGLQRTYGEFSEVPKALGGPATKALGRRALGAAGGGLFDAALGPIGGVIAAGDGRPDNSLSDMQGLTNALHDARKHGTAYPAGAVTSAPMPPAGVPRPGDPGAPSPPISGISPGYQDAQLQQAPQAPQGDPQLPWWATGDMTKMFQGGFAPQAPAPQQAPQQAPQAPSVPMPHARPAEAPQAQPDTSFFMRNAMMMRDPASGELIDPQGAASVRGPDLISKMMTYLHNK